MAKQWSGRATVLLGDKRVEARYFLMDSGRGLSGWLDIDKHLVGHIMGDNPPVIVEFSDAGALRVQLGDLTNDRITFMVLATVQRE